MRAANIFDRSRLALEPISNRKSDLDIGSIKELEPARDFFPELKDMAKRINTAREKKAPVILMAGGHVIRSGVQKYIIDLIEKGFITAFATNGACVIHDFEFALAGETTENVARYISEGRFGLWTETGMLNDIVSEGWRSGMGLGEAVGKAIEEGERFTHKDISVFAACYRAGVTATAHVGIGYDIVHEHPNCDGAAYGATSYTDFLKFASEVEKLNDGVVMNFGTAVMGPEVFLKALAMARNVARAKGGKIEKFSTLVCDIQPAPERWSEDPAKSDPKYYFRPIKTLLVRTVADGGESFYVRGEHGQTIPALWGELVGAVR